MRAAILFLLVWLGLVAEARAEARRGLVVVAREAAMEPAAEVLARALYRERSLRPALDEVTVRAVLGGAVEGPPQAAEFARLARRAAVESDPAIAARLFRSLGDELGVARIVVVERSADRPTARIFAVDEGRFLALSLAARELDRPVSTPDAPPELDWTDAVAALRALVVPPKAEPAAPATKAASVAPATKAASAPPPPLAPAGQERGTPAPRLLSSPWFWGGLAAVVSVGVTVLVLSRTTLDAPGTVVLEGRIAP